MHYFEKKSSHNSLIPSASLYIFFPLAEPRIYKSDFFSHKTDIYGEQVRYSVEYITSKEKGKKTFYWTEKEKISYVFLKSDYNSCKALF